MNDISPAKPRHQNGTDPDHTLGQVLRNWLRSVGRRRNGEPSLRETLEPFIERDEDETELFKPEERAMLLNLLNFGNLRVVDVMVPRADIVAVESASPIHDIIAILREAGHSRLPVYRETLDDIAGMIHVRDLLRFWNQEEPFSLAKAVRETLFVPPSMLVVNLLLQMRATHIHLAIVVDEYGGTDGLVTIEDLVEEIVGEIQDEHDSEEVPALVEAADGMFDADARVPVEELEQRVGFGLVPQEHEEDVDTLGGLVFSLVGRIPARGELIPHPSGIEFEVTDADPRRIKHLRIRNVPSTTTE